MKSRGLGDSIEKITKKTGIKSLVENISEKIGVEDCKCDARREWLNKQFPYKIY